MAREYRFLGIFLLASTLTCLVVWALQNHMYSIGQGYIEAQETMLTELQDRELSAYLDMNRLLTTLSTTVLGAIGFILNSRKSRPAAFVPWLALGSALFVGISIYCGYEAHEDILWMLEGQFFDLNNPQMFWSRVAAFYSFLLGAALFLAFAAATFTAAPPTAVSRVR